MRLKIAAAWIACQLLFFVGWALWEESYLADGTSESILVRVAPTVPRDFLRGQHFRLTYDFSRPNGALAPAASLPTGSPVWVVLKKEGRYHVPKSCQTQPPDRLAPDEVALRGHVKNQSQILYGIERYFVPQGTKEPNREDLSVRLRIDKRGKSRIEQVYLKGAPWP